MDGWIVTVTMLLVISLIRLLLGSGHKKYNICFIYPLSRDDDMMIDFHQVMAVPSQNHDSKT